MDKTEMAWYLSDCGEKMLKEDFDDQAKEWHAAVLHLTAGHFTMPVAILTCNAIGFYPLNFSDAIEVFEEFCNDSGREDWVAYDHEYKMDWTAEGLAHMESYEDYTKRAVSV